MDRFISLITYNASSRVIVIEYFIHCKNIILTQQIASHHADVHSVGVSVAVHGHCLDAQLAGGAHDAACNLATVGDEDLVKHLGCAALRHLRHAPAGR